METEELMGYTLQSPETQAISQAWLAFKEAIGVTSIRSEADYIQAIGGWRLKAAPGGCATKPTCVGWDECRIEGVGGVRAGGLGGAAAPLAATFSRQAPCPNGTLA
jgi:hypothetical protein